MEALVAPTMVEEPASLDRHLFMTLFTRIAHNGEMMSRSTVLNPMSAAVQGSKQPDQHQ